ncbi:PilZ domain-containing protein [Desulfonatronum parangueonense]
MSLLPLPLGQSGFYFQNWEYSFSQAQKPLAMTTILVMLLVIAYASILLYRRFYLPHEPTSFAVQELPTVTKIIFQSVEERSKYDVNFQTENSRRVQFSCSPLKFEPGRGLTLELSGFLQPQSTWIGRPVSCYFKVSTDQKEPKWSFFHFSSTIMDLLQDKSRPCIILETPQRLERKQRRAHLRLDPPREDIPEVRIWPETLSNLDHHDDAPPLLHYLHSETDNAFWVRNISAGGLLLEIRQPVDDEVAEAMEKGKRLFISLFLRDLQQPHNNEYRLLAQIRKSFMEPGSAGSGKLLVGLLFVAHKPRGQPKAEDRWLSLNDKGVEEIEDWVFKRHLQIYQQKGLT